MPDIRHAQQPAPAVEMTPEELFMSRVYREAGFAPVNIGEEARNHRWAADMDRFVTSLAVKLVRAAHRVYLEDVKAASEPVKRTHPGGASSLAEQIAQAQAEVASWTPERRANCRLEGGPA